MEMDDEEGGDSKILAVPIDKLSPLYRGIETPNDLPELTTQHPYRVPPAPRPMPLRGQSWTRVEVAPGLEAREIFWVIKNGINMTGMPSFVPIGVPDQEIWSIAAFLKKLPTVSDQDYKTWTASLSGAN